MRTIPKTFFLLLFFLMAGWAATIPASAQDPGGVGALGNDPDTPVPIDGGLAILLAAGAGYGIRKYRNAKQHGNGK